MNADLLAFVDFRYHVLLICPYASPEPGTTGRMLEWAPSKILGNKLAIRYLPDQTETLIDWRPNCSILLNDKGNPQYTDLSPEEFPDSLAKLEAWKASFNSAMKLQADKNPSRN